MPLNLTIGRRNRKNPKAGPYDFVIETALRLHPPRNVGSLTSPLQRARAMPGNGGMDRSRKGFEGRSGGAQYRARGVSGRR